MKNQIVFHNESLLMENFSFAPYRYCYRSNSITDVWKHTKEKYAEYRSLQLQGEVIPEQTETTEDLLPADEEQQHEQLESLGKLVVA